jgi:hypothetical protein
MPIDRNAIKHVVRAAHEITGRKAFVLVGSGAVVAYYGEDFLTEPLMSTVDIDIYALDAQDPEEFSADLEAIGIDSPFHQAFAYHADGVSPKTASMPTDWRGRAQQVDVQIQHGVTVLIPDPNDIAVAKLCAWREKDRLWLDEAICLRIIDLNTIRARLAHVIKNTGTPDLEERLRRADFLAGQ